MGEQVFDAECILNKRLRKVGAARPGSVRGRFGGSAGNFVTLWCCVAGKVGVPGEVERMVSQVSGDNEAAAAAAFAAPTPPKLPNIGSDVGGDAAGSGLGRRVPEVPLSFVLCAV